MFEPLGRWQRRLATEHGSNPTERAPEAASECRLESRGPVAKKCPAQIRTRVREALVRQTASQPRFREGATGVVHDAPLRSPRQSHDGSQVRATDTEQYIQQLDESLFALRPDGVVDIRLVER